MRRKQPGASTLQARKPTLIANSRSVQSFLRRSRNMPGDHAQGKRDKRGNKRLPTDESRGWHHAPTGEEENFSALTLSLLVAGDVLFMARQS